MSSNKLNDSIWSFIGLSSALTIASLFLDFLWASPAPSNLGDIYEPSSNLSRAVTFFVLLYLLFHPIVLIAHSMNFRKNEWKILKVLVFLSICQVLIGIVALGLAIGGGIVTEELYWSMSWVGGHWGFSIIMLIISLFLSMIHLILLLRAHGSTVFINGTSGNQESFAKLKDDGEMNEVKRIVCCVNCNNICIGVLLVLFVVMSGISISFYSVEPYAECHAKLPSNSPTTIQIAGTYTSQVGNFIITVKPDSEISIKHTANQNKILWQSIKNEAFIRVGLGSFSAPNDHEMGTYAIKDIVNVLSVSQSIDSSKTNGLDYLTLNGNVKFSDGKIVPYILNFTTPSSKHLGFQIIIDPAIARSTLSQPETSLLRIYMVYASSKTQSFFGFGEQFNYFDNKGGCIPTFTREQGIGRGVQPVSYAVNNFFHGAAGSWQTTYSATPMYMTSDLNVFFLDDYGFNVFDLTNPERVSLEILSRVGSVHGRILYGETPLELIEEYTLFSGRMRKLPSWVSEGAVLGLQGGTKVVRDHVKNLLANKVPVRALWLQDWSGKRSTSFGDRLLWNWTADRKFYEGWDEFIMEMHALNIYVLTYINAYLADLAPDSTGKRVEQPMFKEASSLGCLMKDPNGKDLVQISATEDFTFGTVDLTNPACVAWYINVIRTNMLNVTGTAALGYPAGAMGWMADFAESVPVNTKLFSGNGLEVHNEFPELWAKTCQQAIDITSGPVNFKEEVVYFTRAAGPKQPQFTTLQWLGDQMQDFNDYDGLETVLASAASAGISGISMVHSDIGGYLGLKQVGGLIKIWRNKELIKRWSELCAFLDSMYRSHEGNLPKQSWQVVSDADTMEHFGKFARVFKALSFYRSTLILDASNKGHPVARHPFIHYPNDRALYQLKTQLMLGSEFMVCPVLHAGRTTVKCYLPADSGKWVLLWDTKIEYSAGTTIECPAPIGKPCVLFRQGSAIGAQAIISLQNEKVYS